MLTEYEKKILKENIDPNSRQTRYKVRNKTRKTLEDLNFLANVYPDALLIYIDSLTKFLTTFIELKTDLSQYRKIQRLPPKKAKDFNIKRKTSKNGFIQLGGVLRDKTGAPLKCSELISKINFYHDIIQKIYLELKKTCPLKLTDTIEVERIQNAKFKIHSFQAKPSDLSDFDILLGQDKAIIRK